MSTPAPQPKSNHRPWLGTETRERSQSLCLLTSSDMFAVYGKRPLANRLGLDSTCSANVRFLSMIYASRTGAAAGSRLATPSCLSRWAAIRKATFRGFHAGRTCYVLGTRCQFARQLNAPLPLSCNLPPRLAIYPVGHRNYDRCDETTNREQNTDAGINAPFDPRHVGRMIECRHDEAIGQIRNGAESPTNGKCLEAIQLCWRHDIQNHISCVARPKKAIARTMLVRISSVCEPTRSFRPLLSR